MVKQVDFLTTFYTQTNVIKRITLLRTWAQGNNYINDVVQNA